VDRRAGRAFFRSPFVAAHPTLDRLHGRSKGQRACSATLDELNDRILDRMLVIQQMALAHLAKTASKPVSKPGSNLVGQRTPAPSGQTVLASEWALRRQGAEVGRLRQELYDVTAQLWGTASPDLALRPQPQSPTVLEPKRVTLKLPDLGAFGAFDPQLPVNPATANATAFIDARSADRPGSNSSVTDAIGY
jgi:hypothetical protein